MCGGIYKIANKDVHKLQYTTRTHDRCDVHGIRMIQQSCRQDQQCPNQEQDQDQDQLLQEQDRQTKHKTNTSCSQ